MKLSRFVSLFVVMALSLGFVASTAAAQEAAPETTIATVTNTVGDTEFVPGTDGAEGGETVDPDGPTQPSGPNSPVGTTMPGNSGPQQVTPANLNQPTVPQGPSIVAIPQENDGGTPVNPGGPTNPTNGGGNGGGGSSGSSGGGSIIPVVPFTAAQVEALRLQALSILNGISNLPRPTNSTIASNAVAGGVVETETSADVSSTDVSENTDASGNSNVAAAASAIDGSSFFSKLWNGIVAVVTYIPKKVMSLFN